MLLAKLFTQAANLLVLDEPTNDLDMDTLAVLEHLLAEFDGSILLVSHDRTFIDNVVTSTLVFQGNGEISEYAGGYSDWLLQRKDPQVLPAGTSSKSASVKQVTGKPERAGTFAKNTGDNESRLLPDKQAKKAGKAKLSYKLKLELEKLPDRVDVLEAEIQELQYAINTPDFYQQAHETVSQHLNTLADKQNLLEQLMTRWLELEELQE